MEQRFPASGNDTTRAISYDAEYSAGVRIINRLKIVDILFEKSLLTSLCQREV